MACVGVATVVSTDFTKVSFCRLPPCSFYFCGLEQFPLFFPCLKALFCAKQNLHNSCPEKGLTYFFYLFKILFFSSLCLL